MKTLPTLALASAAVLGCSGAMAQYVWQAREAAQAPAAAPVAAPAQPSQGSGAGLMIFVDPATGRIRPPEQEEMRALAARQLAVIQAAPPLVFFTTPSGVIGVRLDPSFDSYIVAKKWSDGALDIDCVPSEAQAIEALSTRAKPVGMVQKKAILDDK